MRVHLVKTRHVNGALFIETARMLQERDLHLPSNWNVTPDGWYPVETFERMAIAWLHLIAAGRPETFAKLGAKTVELLIDRNPDLIVHGDLRETVMRCLVLRQSLFDFPTFEVRGVSDTDVQLVLSHGMSPLAEQAIAHQSAGFLVRLLETCGASNVESSFPTRSWDGDPHTTLEVSWSLH